MARCRRAIAALTSVWAFKKYLFLAALGCADLYYQVLGMLRGLPM